MSILNLIDHQINQIAVEHKNSFKRRERRKNGLVQTHVLGSQGLVSE